MAKKTIEQYIDGLSGWQQEAAQQLHGLVQAAAPESDSAIKWAQPVYSSGGPFAYFKAFKKHINFGFWRGAELEDPAGLLTGDGEKMRHTKISSLEDIQAEPLKALLAQAVALNAERGDPTKG